MRSFDPPNFCVRAHKNHLVPWLYSFVEVSFRLVCRYFIHNITYLPFSASWLDSVRNRVISGFYVAENRETERPMLDRIMDEQIMDGRIMDQLWWMQSRKGSRLRKVAGGEERMRGCLFSRQEPPSSF